MASSLRPRSSVNYKTLNEGEYVFLTKTPSVRKPTILDETYNVERLIAIRKQKNGGVSIIYEYLYYVLLYVAVTGEMGLMGFLKRYLWDLFPSYLLSVRLLMFVRIIVG